MIVRSYTVDLFWREERWYMVGTSRMGTYNRKTAGLWIQQRGLGPHPRCVVFWDRTLYKLSVFLDPGVSRGIGECNNRDWRRG